MRLKAMAAAAVMMLAAGEAAGEQAIWEDQVRIKTVMADLLTWKKIAAVRFRDSGSGPVLLVAVRPERGGWSGYADSICIRLREAGMDRDDHGPTLIRFIDVGRLPDENNVDSALCP